MVNYFKLLIVVFSSFFLIDASGQNLIKGKILDALNNAPVENAVIRSTVNGKAVNAWSDKTGSFSIQKDTSGKTVLLVSILGYQQQTVSVGESESEVSVSLKRSSLDLGVVEIIGTTEHAYTSLAGTATVIDPIEIERVDPIGAQEVLLRVPGVTAAGDDGMGNSRLSIGIRGLDPRRSSRVLIMEDGVPLQPAAYIYPNMYYNPPMERISSIEVVKGSASIKYGPHNMGGIVNYITTRPRNEFGGVVELTGGLNDYRSLFVEAGGAKSSTFKPEIQLLYKSSDGYRDYNHFDQFNGTFKLKIVKGPDHEYFIKANVNSETSQATYTGLTEYSFRTNPTFNPKKFDEFTVFRASLDVLSTKRVRENVLMNTKFYSSYFNRDWWRENDVFVKADEYNSTGLINPVPWYMDGDLIRVGNGRTNFGNLRTFYNLAYERNYDIEHDVFGAKGNFETGARLHWERFEDNKVIGNAPDAREGVYYTTDSLGTVTIVGSSSNYETMAISPFVIEKLRIGSRLVINVGARAEIFEQEHIDRLRGNQYDDTTLLVILPGAGINYAFERSNLFAGYYHGFTPPSSGTFNIVAARGTIDLKPERSRTAELGYRANFTWLNFEAAVFALEIEDFVAASKGTVFENLGKVRTTGIEGAFDLKLSKASGSLRFMPDLHFVYTLMNAKVLEAQMVSALPPVGTLVNLKGNQLPYVPDYSFNVGLSKEIGPAYVSVELHYVDMVFTDFENLVRPDNRGDQGSIPSYYLLNANAGYKISKNWSLSLNGKNLLDKIYIASRLHSNPSQPDPNISSGILTGSRRQVNITLKYTFGKQ